MRGYGSRWGGDDVSGRLATSAIVLRNRSPETMAHRSLLPQAVDDYLRTVVARETPLQQRLRDETSRLPMGGMQIGADQGVLLAFLVRLIGARNAIEVGTFTGYSALVGRERAVRRRTARVLRRERGMDLDRAPLLGRGRRRRPHRIAPAAGTADARGAPAQQRCRRFRFRVHRCRQDGLRRLLRGVPRAPARGRADRDRQCALERHRRRPRGPEAGHRGAAQPDRQDPRRFARRRVPRHRGRRRAARAQR